MTQPTTFTCDTCGHDLSTEQIQTEHKYDIDIAYVVCNECDSRYNLVFDSKETIRLKKKIRKVKEIEHYLQLLLYREMLIVEDDYYKQTYNDLSDEEKKRIGKYQSAVDKQKIKEYNQAIKNKRYDIKDLIQLL